MAVSSLNSAIELYGKVPESVVSARIANDVSTGTLRLAPTELGQLCAQLGVELPPRLRLDRVGTNAYAQGQSLATPAEVPGGAARAQLVASRFGASAPILRSGIDLSAMDGGVQPQADLYRHMNGAWLKRTEIPADKAFYSIDTKLADEAEASLHAIIETAATAAKAAKGSDLQKVGDLYASFMDEGHIEQLGLAPIRADLEAIAAARGPEDLSKIVAASIQTGAAAPLAFSVVQDAKNSSAYIAAVSQSGLSLPDREYYLRDDARSGEIRQAFHAHIEKMLTMAEVKDAGNKADKILDMETAVAKVQWSKDEDRDCTKTYNKMTLADLQALCPGLDWKTLAGELGWKNPDSVVVAEPSYFAALSKLLGTYSLSDWKTYYTWHTLSHFAPLLAKKFVDEDFAFSGHTLEGIKENRPRWKRGVGVVENAAGELLGKLYVEKNFKPEAKARMQELVANLRDAYRDRILSLSWMGQETKHKALEKLTKLNVKIGYPDKWKDYSALNIVPNDLMGNVRRAAVHEFARNMAKLGGPIDRTEWQMTPQTVNAYNDFSMNEVVFPAAILQPPDFDMSADDAVNYGAIGATIGHEMSHAFDDQGRKFDGDGNMVDWWAPQDAAEFERRAAVMVEQYAQFSPLPGLFVDGARTLGENIADLGGLVVAYAAYKKSLGGRQAPVIDGLTGDQRFFLGYAQSWSQTYREDNVRKRLITDEHALTEYRTNGVVANMTEFYSAFGVKPGDPLYRPPEKRVEIW